MEPYDLKITGKEQPKKDGPSYNLETQEEKKESSYEEDENLRKGVTERKSQGGVEPRKKGGYQKEIS